MQSKQLHIVAVVIAVATLLAMAFGNSTASAADDPEAALQALVDGFNESIPSGDGAAAANAFTEDGLFTNTDDAFAIVGRTAMLFAFSQEQDDAFHVTVLDSEVDGSTITGSAEVADQLSVDAGVGSHIELFTITAEGSLVSSFVLTYDHTDPDTETYLEYSASQEEESGEDDLPPGAITIDLEGTEPGSVFVGEFDEGVTFVGLEVQGGPAGVQPAHIHTGTCEEPGGIVYPLASALTREGDPAGGSFTLLSTSQADLLGHDYIVNVHLSEEEPGTYVACAVLKSESGVGLPGTGAGRSGNSNVWWLIAALALVGLLGTAGAAATRRR